MSINRFLSKTMIPHAYDPVKDLMTSQVSLAHEFLSRERCANTAQSLKNIHINRDGTMIYWCF